MTQTKEMQQSNVNTQESGSESMQQTSRQNASQQNQGRSYRPAVDVLELPEELLLIADLPGAKGDQIELHFEDGQLTMRAPVAPRHQDQGRYLLREYGVGEYRRTFRVGQHVDASRISADFADGVLRLHLPKVEAAKPRKISVKANSA